MINIPIQDKPYRVMSEGLCIACPKGWLYPWEATVKPHRYKAVWYAGRGRGWSLPLGRLLFPSSRACLSSFRLAVRFARSHSTAIRLHPAVGYPERCNRTSFRSRLRSPLCSRPQFCRIGQQKKRRISSGKWRGNGGADSSLPVALGYRYALSLPHPSAAKL